ncbi:uncharacterized protein IL334_005628 [Kwoniella shivajii]|uniref:Uncharacterized protein n=1 Tax=Kwoniella shivajii TaxID=564305 RepID=A0ABZ1D3N7_9TREE|nr:hypothetical protein IL334_005628 [Kwoniella shivajii]
MLFSSPIPVIFSLLMASTFTLTEAAVVPRDNEADSLVSLGLFFAYLEWEETIEKVKNETTEPCVFITSPPLVRVNSTNLNEGNGAGQRIHWSLNETGTVHVANFTSAGNIISNDNTNTKTNGDISNPAQQEIKEEQFLVTFLQADTEGIKYDDDAKEQTKTVEPRPTKSASCTVSVTAKPTGQHFFNLTQIAEQKMINYTTSEGEWGATCTEVSSAPTAK